MKKFTWKYHNDEFELHISEIQPRFGDEGVHQKMIIFVNGIRIVTTEWGLGDFISSLTSVEGNYTHMIQYNDGQISYVYNRDKENTYFKVMDTEESTKLIKWLCFCNLPLTEQRKLKIKQWKEKQ